MATQTSNLSVASAMISENVTSVYRIAATLLQGPFKNQ